MRVFNFFKCCVFVLVSVFTGLCVFSGSMVRAESSPEVVVREALTEMKKVGDPSPIVDFIDWDSAYGDLTVERRSIMKVNSVLELREFYRRVLASPAKEMGEVLRSQFKDKLSEMSPEEVQSLMDRIQARAKMKEAEVKEKISGSTFEIKSSDIKGDIATVNVDQTFNGKVESDTIKLHRRDGNWFFSAVPKTSESIAPQE